MQPKINVALKAARSAGDFILHVQDKLLFDQEAGKKPEQAYQDICLNAERTIVNALTKAYPTETITTRLQGEVQTGNEESGTWIIDAIQGQALFTRNLTGYALTVSYLVNGKVEHAVLVNPANKDEFYASKGRGAYLNNSRIRTSAVSSINNSVLGAQFPATAKLEKYQPQQFQLLQNIAEKNGRVMMQDCPALMIANVAAGKLDGVWGVNLFDWEMQAPLLIAKEAGCLFADFNGSPDVYKNGDLLCANARLFKVLLPTVNKYFAK
ncbi:inositol monophosphatase [Marinomonas agarivorans]|nr:inositol monophosphatase [Marinomonas agarivorans]